MIIDWAVDERGIHRVEWLLSTGNTASSAVARRLGMTKEGVLRDTHHDDPAAVESDGGNLRSSSTPARTR